MTSIASQVNAGEPRHIWTLDLDRPVFVFKAFFLVLPLVILFAPRAVGFTPLLLLFALPMDLRFRRVYGRPSYQFILRSLGLLLLWAVLSMTWSPQGADPTLLILIFVCLAGSLAIVPAACLTGAQKAEVRPFALSILVSCVIGLGVLFLAPQGAGIRLLQSVSVRNDFIQISSPHAVSILVVLVWPLIGLIFSKYSRASGRVGFMLAGTLVSGLALLAFRQEAVSNLLALALGGAAFLFIAFQPRVSLTALACLALGYLLLAPIVHMELSGTPAESLVMPAPNSWASRMEIWSRAAQATFDAPILGSGFEAAKFPANDAPRNLFLRIWLELGLVGAILTGGVLFGVIRAIWRRLHNRLEAGIASAVLVSFLTLSLLGMGAWHVWWVGTAWLAASMVVFCRQAGAYHAVSVRVPARKPKTGGVTPQITYTTAHATKTA